MKEAKIRIYDKKIISEIESLQIKKGFTSKNEVLNHLLKLGIKKEKEKEKGIGNLEDIMREFINKNEFMRLSIDEIIVSQNIIKSLLANLYNIKLEEIDGNVIDRELVETGAFGNLSDELEKIERKMMKTIKERKEGGNSI